MTNYSAKILNNSVGSLNAQQAVIATTSNNIANVNTPGYARRSVDLQTRLTTGTQSGISIGNGVEVGRILRIADDFVDRQLRSATTDLGSAEVENQYLSRIQDLFSLTGDRPTIASSLTSFFSSLNDLQGEPASIELRNNVIAKSQELVTTIGDVYGALAEMQDEADQRLATEVQNVNSLTSQIANLNGLISAREAAGNSVAGDERDRRDQLLTQLSQKLNVSIVNGDNGQVSITLDNGFPLVYGTNSRNLEVTSAPTFAATPPPGLSGRRMSYIVYDYDGTAAQSHADLTPGITGGSLGGLLAIRGRNDPTSTSAFNADGQLVSVASRVEALTRNLLTAFNAENLGPDRLPAAGHQASSADLNGTAPSPFGFFSFTGAPSSTATGLPTAGDLAATGQDNFSSILSFAVSGPRGIATSRDLSSGAPTPVYAPGDGSNITALLGLQGRTQTFAIGSYSFTGTYDGAYQEAVTTVGNAKSRAEINERVSISARTAAETRRDEVSGVSLDEEFTNLIKFQKAYQASARMIKIGEQLLDEVLQLL
jgi:flagellar hook-associated protein 1 FlgK